MVLAGGEPTHLRLTTHFVMTHVLIVDDDEEVLELVAELLREVYRVSTAASGRTALDLLAADSSIDCIVLDLMMPQMSGEELAAELQQRGVSTPVLVASARSDTAQVAKLIGARDFVTKPYQTKVLIEKINGICGGAGGAGPAQDPRGGSPMAGGAPPTDAAGPLARPALSRVARAPAP